MKMFWWLPIGSVPEVTPDELARLVNKRSRSRPQILDVRTMPEYEQGHIRNSLHLPIGALNGNIGALPFDKSKPVYAICRSAHRSILAVRLLEMAGYEQPNQLQGGMMAWERSGLPVTKGSD
ncbi:MAG: rhodanese-like domain-containing protein [Hyphomicrobiales bacterium]|nr:MAG: rhodanese-like domain-containing protein [Hyphomicrobiales bacterium]